MSQATDTELSQASNLLSQLLEEAQSPSCQEGGPIILQKKEFDISKMTSIRVISPETSYQKPKTDGTKSDNYEYGHELIKRLLAVDGYTVSTIMIVRESAVVGPASEHKVSVILVRLSK